MQPITQPRTQTLNALEHAETHKALLLQTRICARCFKNVSMDEHETASSLKKFHSLIALGKKLYLKQSVETAGAGINIERRCLEVSVKKISKYSAYLIHGH